MSSSIQLTLDNKIFNININIAELLTKGSINISLNNLSDEKPITIPVAVLVDYTTNVTFRRQNAVKKNKQVILIEEQEPVQIETDTEKRKNILVTSMRRMKMGS